ncbi:hypothetical protein NVP1101O_190 [Vibrio phage 1.101.O._10N.261.45.C6]|nr:hypothetical protein NVP1101O_190 [Vibrio phage 1.101.O._10N.261.45.C6]
MHKNDMGTTGIALRTMKRLEQILLNVIDKDYPLQSSMLDAHQELPKLSKAIRVVEKEHDQNSRTFAQMSIDTYKGQGVFFGSDNVITHKPKTYKY